MTNSKDITRKFLDDIFVIREVDLEASSVSPNTREMIDIGIKAKVKELSDKYPNLESPEKEYLEIIKSFYGLEDKNKYDYSAIEKGKTPLDTPLKQLYNEKKIRTRVYYGLHGADIDYLGEILNFGKDDFSKFRNLGSKSVNEIQKFVSEAGYSLGMNINYVRPENRK